MHFCLDKGRQRQRWSRVQRSRPLPTSHTPGLNSPSPTPEIYTHCKGRGMLAAKQPLSKELHGTILLWGLYSFQSRVDTEASISEPVPHCLEHSALQVRLCYSGHSRIVCVNVDMV